ncbi:hypothetical protein HBI71_158660 [Parastagonospora nodorum]|nr:hypothetical protein HBI71_158660 [Parastagonospora nodorum]KAH5399212.1 hypothetical protein HBI32_181700 [Parastagonospora nodorum]
MAPLSGCLKTSETDLIPSIASLQSCPNLLVVIGDHAYSLGSASRAKSTMRILGRQMAGDLVANVGQKTVVLVLPILSQGLDLVLSVLGGEAMLLGLLVGWEHFLVLFVRALSYC